LGGGTSFTLCWGCTAKRPDAGQALEKKSSQTWKVTSRAKVESKCGRKTQEKPRREKNPAHRSEAGAEVVTP